MIGFHNKQWLIATPMKCGTLGLKNAFVKGAQNAHLLLQEHGTHTPTQELYASRYLMVRDPLDRMVSLYWYAKLIMVYFKKRTDLVEDFGVFMTAVCGNAGKAAWSRSLAQYTDQFCPDHFIRLEHIENDWPFGERNWLIYCRVSKHPTKKRQSIEETLQDVVLTDTVRGWFKHEYRVLHSFYEEPQCLRS